MLQNGRGGEKCASPDSPSAREREEGHAKQQDPEGSCTEKKKKPVGGGGGGGGGGGCGNRGPKGGIDIQLGEKKKKTRRGGEGQRFARPIGPQRLKGCAPKKGGS